MPYCNKLATLFIYALYIESLSVSLCIFMHVCVIINNANLGRPPRCSVEICCSNSFACFLICHSLSAKCPKLPSSTSLWSGNCLSVWTQWQSNPCRCHPRVSSSTWSPTVTYWYQWDMTQTQPQPSPALSADSYQKESPHPKSTLYSLFLSVDWTVETDLFALHGLFPCLRPPEHVCSAPVG